MVDASQRLSIWASMETATNEAKEPTGSLQFQPSWMTLHSYRPLGSTHYKAEDTTSSDPHLRGEKMQAPDWPGRRVRGLLKLEKGQQSLEMQRKTLEPV